MIARRVAEERAEFPDPLGSLRRCRLNDSERREDHDAASLEINDAGEDALPLSNRRATVTNGSVAPLSKAERLYVIL